MSFRYSACFSLRSPNIRSDSTSEKPMIALRGVRSSCDMLARNSDLCWLATSSCRLLSAISRLLASSSLNSLTFSIAITAWSAKVLRSAICLTENGPASARDGDSPDWVPLSQHRNNQNASIAQGSGKRTGRRGNVGVTLEVAHLHNPAIQDGRRDLGLPARGSRVHAANDLKPFLRPVVMGDKTMRGGLAVLIAAELLTLLPMNNPGVSEATKPCTVADLNGALPSRARTQGCSGSSHS